MGFYTPNLKAQNNLLLDDGKAPVDRFIAGQKITGVYGAFDPLHCSQIAKNKYVPDMLPEDTVIKTLSSGKKIKVAGNIKILNKIIGTALDKLNQNGDVLTQNKHICTGFYQDERAKNGNALSLYYGYLKFDFKLIQYLYDLPDSKRSSWVFDFLALHEFAHQLQYWNGDEEIIKAIKQQQSSKVSELAADCTASALISLLNINLSNDLYKMSFVGVFGAAEALGDFDIDAQTHHGTPKERVKAAQYGEYLVSSQKDSLLNKNLKLTSKSLLLSCNSYINLTMN